MINTVAELRSSAMEMMMTTPNDLSDKALVISAFAAFHQLEGGDAITSVIANDAAGHRAGPEAVAELEAKELGEPSGERFVFQCRRSADAVADYRSHQGIDLPEGMPMKHIGTILRHRGRKIDQ